MNKLTYAVVTMALFGSLATIAQAETDYNHHLGTYIEGNLGTNLYALGVLSSDTVSTGAGVQGYSWNAALGYKMNYWFGLEGGFTRSSVLQHGHDDTAYYQSINAPYASMRFTAPIAERFSVFGKLGVMYANGKDEKPDVVDPGRVGILLPYVGFGAAYAVTPKVDVNLQYQGAVYGVVNAGALTGGVTYHF